MKVVIVKSTFGDNFDAKLDWCEKQFGKRNEVTGVYQAEMYRWCYEIIGFGLNQIYFRNEKDYLLYLMRWT